MSQTVALPDKQDSMALLSALMVEEAFYRAKQYHTLRITEADSEEVKQQKMMLLLQELFEHSTDIVKFVNFWAWTPDAKGQFGSDAIARECSHLVQAELIPGGAVPIVLFPKQTEVIREFQRLLDLPGGGDLAVVKSRQVALTTLLGGWSFLWAWLFRPGFSAAVTSYDEEQIDAGGKGAREADSLFGRYRMFLDYMCLCMPAIKFNQHRKSTNFSKLDERTGMNATQDVRMKLVRPKWTVYQQEIFKSAEKNWIRGSIAGDSFARGWTLTATFKDELGQFNEKRANIDRASWAATNQNTKVRATGGTIPRMGGPGTLFYELMEDESDISTSRFWIHWSDVPPYMVNAKWVCRGCKWENEWAIKLGGPGRKGPKKKCEVCEREQQITYKDMTSDWFKKQVSKAKGDLVAIARELQMDWMAAQGDTLFSNLPLDLVGPVDPRNGTGLIYDGVDPGVTMANPGAWMASRLDPVTLDVEIFGCWVAANAHTEYWVPFLKRWHSSRLAKMRVVYGKMKGRTFMEAFSYSDEACKMLDLCSQFPIGHIQGDKYGSHNMGEGSFYEGLQRYGIYVSNEYTKDREDLVREGIEMAARIKLWEKTCDIRPPTPMGGQAFPSMHQAFTTAMPMIQEGEGKRKLDVSKKLPKWVSNPIDAHFYMVRGMGVEVHHVPDRQGDWGVEDGGQARCESFGDSVFGM